MLVKAVWHLLRIAIFDFSTRRSFRDYMIAFAWLIAIAALYVSMPHTAEVLHSYEGGDETNKALKAWSMTLIIELTAGALFLIALHSKGLSDEQRKNIAAFSVPFYILTGEIQAAYFFHITNLDWVQIGIAAQLALVLPYCTFVSINIIGYLLSTNPTLPAAIKAITNIKILGISIIEAREVGEELKAAQTEITRLHEETAQLRDKLLNQPQSVAPVQTITIKDEQAARQVIELQTQVANLTRILEDTKAEMAQVATSHECGHEKVLEAGKDYIARLEQDKLLLESEKLLLEQATLALESEKVALEAEKNNLAAENHALAEARRVALHRLEVLEKAEVKVVIPEYPKDLFEEMSRRVYTTGQDKFSKATISLLDWTRNEMWPTLQNRYAIQK